MPKPNTTTATVSRFDPLDRKWYMNAKKTKVSVSIGPTLRQTLKNIIRAAGQQEADSRFWAVRAADGVRLWLSGRGVQVGISGLRHAEGTQVPEEVDGDGGTVQPRSVRASLPPGVPQGLGETPIYTPFAGKQATDPSRATVRARDAGPRSRRGAPLGRETVRRSTKGGGAMTIETLDDVMIEIQRAGGPEILRHRRSECLGSFKAHTWRELQNTVTPAAVCCAHCLLVQVGGHEFWPVGA